MAKAATPPAYSQKYLLQRRNDEGHLIRVETFTEPVSPEKVLAQFGPGYYVLKSTKPRFATIWKQPLGETKHAKELHRLKKRTDWLTCGVVGLGAIDIVGFGLAHKRFSVLEKNMDKIKVLIQTRLKPEELRCGNCQKPLDFLLQQFCSQCGMPIDWPSRILLTQRTGLACASECLKCGSLLLQDQIYCPDCGQQRPIFISAESKSTWTPVSPATSR